MNGLRAADAPVTVIDFETTGVVPGYPEEPWQIGFAALERGRLVAERRLELLLGVGRRPFNPCAPGRHAQVREALAEARPLQELWPELRPWVEGRVLCAHGASTEKRLLRKAFPLHRAGPWLDTLKLCRLACPAAPSYRLEDLLAHLGLRARADALCPGLEPHDALYDAVGCGLLLEHLLGLEAWKDIPLETLIHARRAGG